MTHRLACFLCVVALGILVNFALGLAVWTAVEWMVWMMAAGQ